MKRPMQKFVWGTVVTAAALLLATSAGAQEAATVVLLDRNAIAVNVAPANFTAADINVPIADVGVRDALPYFNARPGKPLTLPGGVIGHEGWIAVSGVPAAWVPNTEVDGLENFIWAGPGLGSPDAGGNRTSLLVSPTSLVPLGATGLQQLVGRTICAVAFRDELPRLENTVSLTGPTLGLLAFTVEAMNGGTATTLPFVDITIQDTREVCGGALVPMADAPAAGM